MMQNSDPPSHSIDDDDIAGEVPELDAKIQAILGMALQTHFEDLVQAPIPDRFLVLLAQLEAKEKKDA
jgi:anti-sigma factor ChrR (cupin superfamily)